MRERSHSFWIPESRSYGRSISCHSRALEKAAKAKTREWDFKDIAKIEENRLFLGRNYLKIRWPRPRWSRRVERISQENSPPSLSFTESLSCFPRERDCCYINRNRNSLGVFCDQINIFFARTSTKINFNDTIILNYKAHLRLINKNKYIKETFPHLENFSDFNE